MKVNLLGNIYKNRVLKKGLEFAADNGALFSAGTALTLSTVARPIAIYSAPKTDKENRKLACAKSFASTLVGFGLMLGATLPVSSSIKKINKTPEKYLKKETISTLKDKSKPLISSKGYQFATQLFKLGTGAFMAAPKAIVTCALIPPMMNLFFKKNKKGNSETTVKNNNYKNLTFTGRLPNEPITKGISKVLDNNKLQQFVEKHKNSNYPMHISAVTDTLTTATFIAQTYKSKKIEKDRKNFLSGNAAISTGLSIVTSYIADKILDKPTEKFINKFRTANPDCPKLEKYVEGIKIAKPALIMGGIYYCVIPFLSTFIADKIKITSENSTVRHNT